MPKKILDVPESIDRQVATDALAAMDVKIDRLSKGTVRVHEQLVAPPTSVVGTAISCEQVATQRLVDDDDVSLVL